MATGYVTFKGTTTGVTDAFYMTQAAADAGATDADITAVQGEQTIEDGHLPNQAYWDGSKLLEEIPELVVFAGLSDENKMKVGTRGLHDGLVNLQNFLDTIAHYYPVADVTIAHDMLTFSHRAIRGVMLGTHWTNAQKLLWLQAMALGPTDVPPTNPIQYFEVVEENRVAVAAGGDSPPAAIVAPTDYFMWAHPNDATRWSLADCVSNTADEVSNMAAAATDSTVFVNGSWIDSITG